MDAQTAQTIVNLLGPVANMSDGIEIVENFGDLDVYVNFAYAQALVIESEDGSSFSITAMAWDATHGVSGEKEIGIVDLPDLERVVREFLVEQRRDEDEIDSTLSSLEDD